MEGYLQDAWRIQPNLTFTYGVRYSFLQTPWETKGQQIAPTVDTHAWSLARECRRRARPDLSTRPELRSHRKLLQQAGFYPANKKDFAPRLAIAYALTPRHPSARASASTTITSAKRWSTTSMRTAPSASARHSPIPPPASIGLKATAPLTDCSHPGAPRFTDRNTLPNIAASHAGRHNASSPISIPLNSFSIQSGLDSQIKTPYSESMDFSVQRELPGGFTLEASYVGRLGRRLLQSLDIAEPVNYKDPSGGGDYFTAGTQLSKVADQHGGACGGATCGEAPVT